MGRRQYGNEARSAVRHLFCGPWDIPSQPSLPSHRHVRPLGRNEPPLVRKLDLDHEFKILNHMVKLKDDPALDQIFAALGDSTRRGIVAMLGDGRERTLGELAAPWRMSLPGVSKHVRVLEAATLVASEKRGRVRWCHLRTERLRPAADWLAFYQRFWSDRFDELDQFLTDANRPKPTEPT